MRGYLIDSTGKLSVKTEQSSNGQLMLPKAYQRYTAGIQKGMVLKMKGLVSMTTGIVTGVAVGTAVGMVMKQMKTSKSGSKTKKMTSMALNAMGEAFHNMANHVR